METRKTKLSKIANNTLTVIDIVLGAAPILFLLSLFFQLGFHSAEIWLLYPFFLFSLAFFTKNILAIFGALIHSFVLIVCFSAKHIAGYAERGWNTPVALFVFFYLFLTAGVVLSTFVLIMAYKKAKEPLIKKLSFVPSILFFLCCAILEISFCFLPDHFNQFKTHLPLAIIYLIIAPLFYLIPRSVFVLYKREEK